METEGTKRKLEDISKEAEVRDYDTCVHCQRMFYMDSELAQPCNYHTGKKLLNADVRDEYTKLSTEPTKEKYEDCTFGIASRWACCQEDGNHTGCQTRKHEGKKYPDAVRITPHEDEIEPGAKHQRVDESGRKSSSSATDLTDEAEVPKAATIIPKAQEMTTIPDPHGVEEGSEEDDSEGDVESDFLETCTVCGEEYSANDEEPTTCLSHNEGLVVVEDCPLSDAEKEEA